MTIFGTTFQDYRKVVITTLFAETSPPTSKLRKKLMQHSEIKTNGPVWQFIMLLALQSFQVIVPFKSIVLRSGKSVLIAFQIPQVTLRSVFVASLISSRLVDNDDAFLF